MEEAADCKLFFANIEQWGPAAQGFMRKQAEAYDVLGMVETHKRGQQLEAAKVELSKDGWKCVATPARWSGKSATGTTGGEWIVSRKTTAITSFEGLRRSEIARTGKDPFAGIAPALWHTKTGNIIVISLYLLPGQRLRGDNEQVLVRVSSFLKLMKDPWIIMADWNVPRQNGRTARSIG